MSLTIPIEPPTPLAALRAATRAHHDRIDRLMDLRNLGDRARYIRILQVFDGFLAAWEPGLLGAIPTDTQDWMRARSRRRFLAQDLRALGAARKPAAARVPRPATAAAAWGSAYVIEGSALGGQVITRALAADGLHPHCGTAYFHGWGDATGSMWREFRQRLERQLHSPGALAQACEGACATFDTLSGLLEDALHERTPVA